MSAFLALTGCGGSDHKNVRPIREPEDRTAIKQYIADCAAADRGHECENHDAKQIELLSPSRERAADGEHRHADKVEYDGERHARSLKKANRWPVILAAGGDPRTTIR